MSEVFTREYKDIRISVPWGYIDGRWYGNREVRPILAIHGWLDNLGTWDTLLPLLPQHVGYLCIDLPGHGRSSRYPKGFAYHLIDYVHIIRRIMEEYKWEKVSLLAHSMGAIASFLYVCLYPKKVDMFVGIDILNPLYRTSEALINRLSVHTEKTLVLDERLDNLDDHEPPSYTYAELERLLYEGSGKSVDLENCKYLLERSIIKSKKYPDKYYFSRDAKVKYYYEFSSTPELTYEMAKRIRNIPYLVIKGSKSTRYINKDSIPVIELLQQSNPHFEFHVIEGTHHVHLNNPKEVAAVMNPFINAHRPAMLNTWSVDDDNETQNVKAIFKSNGTNSMEQNTSKYLKSKL